jgi:hypothetical protein
MIHGVQDEFYPRGNSELIEDTEQIFLHGVLTQCQLMGDLFVRQAFCDQRHPLFFTRSEKAVSLCIDDAQRGDLSNEIEQVVDLLGAGPNLTAVNNLYTFAKQAKRWLNWLQTCQQRRDLPSRLFNYNSDSPRAKTGD